MSCSYESVRARRVACHAVYVVCLPMQLLSHHSRLAPFPLSAIPAYPFPVRPTAAIAPLAALSVRYQHDAPCIECTTYSHCIAHRRSNCVSDAFGVRMPHPPITYASLVRSGGVICRPLRRCLLRLEHGVCGTSRGGTPAAPASVVPRLLLPAVDSKNRLSTAHRISSRPVSVSVVLGFRQHSNNRSHSQGWICLPKLVSHARECACARAHACSCLA